MTLHTKINGTPKSIEGLFCKIDGAWRTIGAAYVKEGDTWKVIYTSGGEIEFMNYPYPIPVSAGWSYSTDGSTWTKVTADGVINASGTFTGYVKANTLSLTDFYTEGQEGGHAVGSPLAVARQDLTSFANSGKGYVCGGTGLKGLSSAVDVYDTSGNRTNGTGIGNARAYLTSFVNSEKGYVCGGGNYNGTYYSDVAVYDSAGNMTTGTSLSEGKKELTSFVNNNKGFVCGGLKGNGYNYAANIDVYDSSGNRTTLTDSVTGRFDLTSFVNAEKGYVCGGVQGQGYLSNIVRVFDSAGNITSGKALSVKRQALTSFVNGGKGYVCGGESYYSDVDVYDSSGNRTTGTPLSKPRGALTSFVLKEKGYVCGGERAIDRATSECVDIYDSSGNRTTGVSLIGGGSESTSFVNGGKGYVCGGYEGAYYQEEHTVVDVYTPEYYKANIPITEGSTYTLNGESGVADRSKVMTFDSKVTGTVKYKEGDVTPAIKVSVVDVDGNPISGATITISEDVKIYSLIYDKAANKTDPKTCLTYAGENAGFTPMSGGSGNANEGSWAQGNGTIFDAMEVGYLNGSTWVAQDKSAVAGSTSYNCFTRIPRIYQKVTDLGNNKVQLDLALKPFDGATLHPAFVMDGVELNHKYIGRYLGYNASGTLQSRSGKSPTVSQTRATFRTQAKANGSNHGLMSYYDRDLVNKLYLLAFKDFNSQTAVGIGLTNSSAKVNTGGSNGKSWMYGTTSSVQVSFLGIEDWWGNLWQWIDNYLTDSNYLYVSQTANPSDNVSSMNVLCANPKFSGYYPDYCNGGLNDFFIGSNQHTANSSTKGLCDYQWFHAGSCVARVGGFWRYGSYTGAFYFYSSDSLSDSNSYVGARLIAWD